MAGARLPINHIVNFGFPVGERRVMRGPFSSLLPPQLNPSRISLNHNDLNGADYSNVMGVGGSY
jgi:hypothetical protein